MWLNQNKRANKFILFNYQNKWWAWHDQLNENFFFSLFYTNDMMLEIRYSSYNCKRNDHDLWRSISIEMMVINVLYNLNIRWTKLTYFANLLTKILILLLLVNLNQLCSIKLVLKDFLLLIINLQNILINKVDW